MRLRCDGCGELRIVEDIHPLELGHMHGCSAGGCWTTDDEGPPAEQAPETQELESAPTDRALPAMTPEKAERLRDYFRAALAGVGADHGNLSASMAWTLAVEAMDIDEEQIEPRIDRIGLVSGEPPE